MEAIVEYKVSDMAIASHGISLLPKLKMEHLQLTSFSRMSVDLAAQVSLISLWIFLLIIIIYIRIEPGCFQCPPHD